MRGNHHPEATPLGDWSSARLQTTHWSVVLAAGSEPSSAAQDALEYLLRTYWYPLYVYVRRRGNSPEDAQDLIQSFFLALIQKGRLRLANPERGRFRSFLLASLNHFAANEQDAQTAIKRGGRIQFLPLDVLEIESRFAGSLSENSSPEMAYDRHWALALLEVVLRRLRQEQESTGRGEVFDLLKPYLEGDPETPRYAELGARLQVSEGAARMIIHRLRRRYRDLILEEIQRTLADPGQADEELKSLLAALREGR